jgi:hypothetical protein
MNYTAKHVNKQYIAEILNNQGKINFSNFTQKCSSSQLTRFMTKTYNWQKLLFMFIHSLINLLGAFIIIDDTIIEKPYSKAKREKGEIVRYVYSHKHHKVIIGIQLVLMLLVIGNIRIPLMYRIYDGHKTKNEHVLEMLSIVRNRYKIKPKAVMFDTWYSCKKLLKRINDYGWIFVCRIKKNRKISGKQAKHYFKTPYGIDICRLSGMKVTFIRHRIYYLVCNRTGFSKKMIRDLYAMRNVIEHFFKEIKSYLKLNDCQSASSIIWSNHIFFNNLAFCFVELKRRKHGLTVCKTKRKFKFKDYSAFYARWEKLIESE